MAEGRSGGGGSGVWKNGGFRLSDSLGGGRKLLTAKFAKEGQGRALRRGDSGAVCKKLQLDTGFRGDF
jgi:hypothetical protein